MKKITLHLQSKFKETKDLRQAPSISCRCSVYNVYALTTPYAAADKTYPVAVHYLTTQNMISATEIVLRYVV